jgi:hypothetical protein
MYESKLKMIAYSGFAQTIDNSTKKSLWTTLLVLIVMGGLIMMTTYYGKEANTEHYVGNVGNQGIYNLQREPAKKQLGCYTDMDCPDEAKCTDQGICVPIIHELPRSKHTLKWGRGREKEKTT